MAIEEGGAALYKAVDYIESRLAVSCEAQVALGHQRAAAASADSRYRLCHIPGRMPAYGRNIGKHDFIIHGILPVDPTDFVLHGPPGCSKMISKRTRGGVEWVCWAHFDFRLKWNQVLKLFKSQGAFTAYTCDYPKADPVVNQ